MPRPRRRKFSVWFGDAEEFELIHSGSNAIADRLHVFYRLRVTKLVEQHLLCAFDGDRISGLDLVCTGFRPDEGDRNDAPRLPLPARGSVTVSSQTT
jgi:hypothetical protein